jgi:Ca2+-binding EF-hand superfamily protein
MPPTKPRSALTRKNSFLRKVTKYAIPDDAALRALWDEYDLNANGMLSLAEIDKIVVAKFPEFDDKPALMRAYKFADADGSGLITKQEFSLLLRSLVYYKELWENFEEIDADDDRRITLEEFERGAPIIGLELSHAEVSHLPVSHLPSNPNTKPFQTINQHQPAPTNEPTPAKKQPTHQHAHQPAHFLHTDLHPHQPTRRSSCSRRWTPTTAGSCSSPSSAPTSAA